MDQSYPTGGSCQASIKLFKNHVCQSLYYWYFGWISVLLILWTDLCTGETLAGSLYRWHFGRISILVTLQLTVHSCLACGCHSSSHSPLKPMALLSSDGCSYPTKDVSSGLPLRTTVLKRVLFGGEESLETCVSEWSGLLVSYVKSISTHLPNARYFWSPGAPMFPLVIQKRDSTFIWLLKPQFYLQIPLS